MTRTPTIGRIVHYQLSEHDATQINKRRKDAKNLNGAGVTLAGQELGAQIHTGNDVRAGDVFPLIITRVWQVGTVNGQVILDGNDSLWAMSVSEGEGQRGHWSWPPRN